MPQVRVLGRGAQVTGGVVALLLALQTWSWVAYDIAGQGFSGIWELWTGTLGQGSLPQTIPVTTATDLGLGLLQTAAACAALARSRMAGGMLAVTAVLTLGYRIPVLWQAVIGNPTTPFYAGPGFKGDDTVLGLGWGTCVVAVLLCLLLGIVLLAGQRTWPPLQNQALQNQGTQAAGMQNPAFQNQDMQGPGMQPGMPGAQPVPQQAQPPAGDDPPQRPAPGAAVVAGLFLAVLAVLDISWIVYLSVQGGAGFLFDSGEGRLASVLAVPSYWAWLLETVVCLVGALVVLTRRIAARGYALAVALSVLPVAVTGFAGQISSNMFFNFSGHMPGYAVLLHLQLFLTPAGGIVAAVLALRPGVPVQPGTAPAGPVLFGQQPAGAYGQQPGAYLPQQPAQQPPMGHPMGAPVQPPMSPPPGAAPGYGYPSAPPQPPAGGGFGPPPGA